MVAFPSQPRTFFNAHTKRNHNSKNTKSITNSSNTDILRKNEIFYFFQSDSMPKSESLSILTKKK